MDEQRKVYDHMMEKNKENITNNNLNIHPELLDIENDKRKGFALGIYFPEEIQEKLLEFLVPFKEAEPDQYYYHKGFMHITVCAIIENKDDFKLAKFDTEPYIEALTEAFEDIEPFDVELKGITLSNDAMILQGFPDETMQKLRNNIITSLKNKGLRYEDPYIRDISHSTLIRFKKPLKDPESFVKMIEDNRDTLITKFTVNKITLKNSDYYNTPHKVKTVKEFYLD